MSEQNKAITRRLLEEAAGRGDLSVAEELVAPDFLGHADVPEHETRGIEGYKGFITMLRTAFPDLRMTVEDQVAEGDRVVTRWSARGTHQGDFLGIPPTGRAGQMTGVNVDRIEGGKVAECWSNSDELGLLTQIGAIPSPAAAQ